uniref:CAAX prenyl protease 2 n=1 Tax=Amphiprion ocellaris TaxID=80972 RepID=A0A3Q1BX57_AMPOC
QVFYLGPFIHSAMDDPDDVQSWRLCVRDAVWLRNQVVAPVTEELVFRGAMLPMLVPCAGPTAAICVAPLFFGVGMQQLRLPGSSQPDILYTTLFGAFTAFIFMRTGHVGPVLCHSFCNSQGLPDVTSALQHPQRPPLLFSYLMGILLFLVLLFPLTDPFFYGAIPVCSLGEKEVCVCSRGK